MKGKFMLAAITVGAIVLYLSGCAKESADRLSAGDTCDTTGVSYSKQILPILEDNCYTCHQGAAASSGIDLSNFATLQAHVANGDLVSAVTHTGSVTPMPYELPMLPSCEVNTIVAWVHQGALNN
jgi:hypothetical protein